MATTQEAAARLAAIVKQSARTVFFGGAGVSTESGLPDFRSLTARTASVERFGHQPEDILSTEFFANDPRTFYQYLQHFLINPSVQPNDAHRVLARWQAANLLEGIVTQNIDGLHQLAGSSPVWELHGTLASYHCVNCGAADTLSAIIEKLHQAELPRCAWGGIVKPDVVLYGEALPSNTFDAAAAAISQADTLIVGGTSLQVYPAAGLINLFTGDNLVLINMSDTPADSAADLVIKAPISAVLKEADRHR